MPLLLPKKCRKIGEGKCKKCCILSVRPHAHTDITHAPCFHRLRADRGAEGDTQTLSSLSLACPCCVHLSAHFKKATWGWVRSGLVWFAWAALEANAASLRWQTETVTGDAECLKRCIVNLCMYERVYVCVCALKLLQNGGPNGGKIAAK